MQESQFRRERTRPSSVAQCYLWRLEQDSAGDDSALIMSTRLLQRAVSAASFSKAFGLLAERHEALRAQFVVENGQPLQLVEPLRSWEVVEQDFRGLSAHLRDAAIVTFLENEATRSFDFSGGPLVRLSMALVEEGVTILIITLHRMVTDNGSLEIMWGELLEHLSRLERGASESKVNTGATAQPSLCPEAVLPVMAEIFRQHQRSDLESPAMSRLPGASSWATGTGRSASAGLLLSEDLSGSLVVLSAQENSSVAVVLLAAVLVLLHRYDVEDELAIGLRAVGRNHDLETRIGCFEYPVSLRADLSGNTTFHDFLRALVLQVDRMQRQVSPDASSPRFGLTYSFYRTRSHARYLSSAVGAVRHESTQKHSTAASRSVRSCDRRGRVGEVDVIALTNGSCLEVWIEYPTGQYCQATVERFLCNLEVLLRGIVRDVRCDIDRLPVLSECERQILVYEWNERGRAHPRSVALQTLIENQVDASPESAAVIEDDTRLTYAELDIAANRVAHQLIAAGVRRGDIVALCLDRSTEFVVLTLATLKSGAAFLPLDPQYPRDRIQFMLEDAGVKLVLVSERYRALVPQRSWTVLGAESLAGQAPACRQTRPGVSTGGGDVCYVIYTSGSTGQPKGARLEHRGIVNCVRWTQGRFGLDHSDRILLKENCSHDASMWEIFAPLTCGAALVVVPADRHLDVGYIIQTIRRHRVSVAYFFGSLIDLFLQDSRLVSCCSLRHVLCGGEPLSHDVMRRYLGTHTAPLHIRYGQTEVSIASALWTCDPAYQGNPLPVGTPIDNTRAYIVDKHGGLVPIGAVGELMVAGVSVGRGYLNRPQLTAERFGVDPFRSEAQWQEEDRRTYRTGDLARYLPDGSVCLLGRMDGQIKIHGRRIELGEIQAVIEAHEQVKEACVIANALSSGEKRLIAAVVWAVVTTPDRASLDAHARRKLPSYMVPTIVTVTSMPRLPNGKIDRVALAALAESVASNGQRSRPHMTALRPIESRIAHIWEELLATRNVGLDDDFFALGGDSVAAMRVAARISETFQVEVPATVLFEAATLRALAARIGAEMVRMT